PEESQTVPGRNDNAHFHSVSDERGFSSKHRTSAGSNREHASQVASSLSPSKSRSSAVTSTAHGKAVSDLSQFRPASGGNPRSQWSNECANLPRAQSSAALRFPSTPTLADGSGERRMLWRSRPPQPHPSCMRAKPANYQKKAVQQKKEAFLQTDHAKRRNNRCR